MPQITNPAAEIYSLCDKLNGLPAGQDRSLSTRDVLARAFSVSIEDPEFYSILAALSGRFDHLRKIISVLPNYPEPQRQLAQGALANLKGFLRPHNLSDAWASIKANTFKPEFLLPVHMIDPLVQQIAPISLPTVEEKNDILNKLDEAIASLNEANSFAATSLVISLQAVRRILQKLEFFGVEELLNGIVGAQVHLRAATQEANSRPGSSVWSGIRKAAVVLTVVLNTIIMHDAGMTALENDYTRGQALIEFIARDIKVSPLLLPSPTSESDGDNPNAILPDDSEQQRSKGD